MFKYSKLVSKFSSNQTQEPNSILREMEVQDYLQKNKNKMRCNGCGVKLQIENQQDLGFIKEEKMLDILRHNLFLKEKLDNYFIDVPNNYSEQNQSSQNFIKSLLLDQKDKISHSKTGQVQLEDLDLIMEMDAKQQNYEVSKQKLKEFKKLPIKCERCINLIGYNQDIYEQEQREQENEKNQEKEFENNDLEEQLQFQKEKQTQQQNNQKYMDQQEKKNQEHLTKQKNVELFLEKLFAKIKKKSTILFVVDSTDIFGTLNLELLKYCFLNRLKVILILNKFDVLNENYTQLNLIKHIIKKKLQNDKSINQARIKNRQFDQSEEQIDENVIQMDASSFIEEIFFVSSQTGDGFKGFINYIKNVKQQAIQQKNSRWSKNFYVVGYTNSGKSSFINMLNKMTNKYSKKETLILKQDSILKSIMGEKLENWQENTNIYNDFDENQATSDFATVSSIPNTTLDIIRIHNEALKIEMYDTPGIPNFQMLSSQFESVNDSKMLVINKTIQPKTFLIKENLTLFIGGLMRIDFASGLEQGINIVFFGSNHIGGHITKTEKANQVYIKQYGQILSPVLKKDPSKIKFQKHQIKISFNHKGVGNQDLEVFGLGWFSFCNTFAQDQDCYLTVYLPENVKFEVRQSIFRFQKELLNQRLKTRTIKTNQNVKQMKKVQSHKQQKVQNLKNLKNQ
ncbi:P-loop containing nucleoside triphosphate hydrolase [Pseudocohnilembus persalinus]|uniref:p-loop containing nucleoside triphosphate hydrolase n=1 Tax=Pseudocohnilembus persalinus TaxID=266149 RepID=A0A0V0QPG6_PSEPJ|nr:P-loop containing nucleoside triphosphate hydrolase [Pseudocohnilembus persalinus]|eukprot:KRX03978.1 P-loop containing nucleoside triphosphate hydrolase [Pseudocohnilembus persalinus]